MLIKKTLNKTEQYLNNLTPEALKQALRFILDVKTPKDSIDNIGFIKLQIEDMARMYPEFEVRKQKDEMRL